MRGKKTLVFCLIAILLVSTAITYMATSLSKPRVYLDPSTFTFATHDPADLEPGDQITTSLNVEDVSDLWGWSVTLLFEPAVLQVYGMGTMFTTWLSENADPANSTVYAKRKIMNSLGYLTMNQFIDPENATGGASTSGVATLATITFNITARGVSALDLDSELITVVGETPIAIDHDVEDGLFDNRLGNPDPVAMFTGPSTAIQNYDAVTFDASGSSDDGWIVSYEWDFGDGTSEIYVEGVNLTTTATHTFASAGTFPVTLTVTDNDDATNTTATHDITILAWMEGGTFPDLVGWEAKPEFPRLDESPSARGLDLRSLVGNPTDDNYTVYVEFTLISKDEANVLGTLNTDPEIVGPGDKQELRAYFNTTDPTWRCFSGSPEWVSYGYTHWFFHKYVGYASVYYKNSTMSEFEKAYVAKYLSFNVAVFDTHDIAVLNIESPDEVEEGDTMDAINVTMANNGGFPEVFRLTVSYVGAGGVNGTIAEKWVQLAIGENKTETFSWNTGALDPGPYLIVATLPALPYETAVGDNSKLVRVNIVAAP